MVESFFREAVVLSPLYTPDNSPDGIAARKKMSQLVKKGIDDYFVSSGCRIPTIENRLYNPNFRVDAQQLINCFYEKNSITTQDEKTQYKLPSDQLHALTTGFTFWKTVYGSFGPREVAWQEILLDLRKDIGAIKLNEHREHILVYNGSIDPSCKLNFKMIQNSELISNSPDTLFFDIYIRFKMPKISNE